MSSLLDDILGNGLRVLILGSYDHSTKKVLDNIRNGLNETFERYSCITLLLDNIEVRIPLSSDVHSYLMLIEREGEGGTVYVFQGGTKPLAMIPYENGDDFKKKVGSDSEALRFNEFRRMSELEKVVRLSQWADIIYVIRHLESTRGGELIELIYLLLQPYQDPLKYEFFYRRGVNISTMLKEIVGHYKIGTTDYKSYKELQSKVTERTKEHISRLNATIGRFKQFDNI